MPPALKAPQTLCGTAIRTKTFLQIKVHAFAIYVDAPAMARDLAAWKGIESKDLEHDRSFYQTMLEDNFDKTLRMILCRNVNSEDMREAFDDDLGPRVKRAGKELDMPGGVEALQTFKSFFNLDKIKKKTEFIFTWHPGGTLSSAIDRKPLPDIENKALCWALFDNFLGDKPIEKKGEKTVMARVPDILTKTNPAPARPAEASGKKSAGK